MKSHDCPLLHGLVRRLVGIAAMAIATTSGLARAGEAPPASLTLIPPSPVTDRIELDLRAAVRNGDARAASFDAAFYWDEEKPQALLHRETIEVGPHAATGVRCRIPLNGRFGKHCVVFVARSTSLQLSAEQPIEVLASDVRSTRRLGGAWVDLFHFDDAEGKPFNDDLGKMTAAQWRELVRAMHGVDQNILVITMMFQNTTHYGLHKIETEGYRGKAFYPSALYPGRMPIASPDPLEAILGEADRLGMHVMPGVGQYAFFDYTPGALAWCEKVADELWRRYGHHPSFYGWYISAEQFGDMGDAKHRQETIDFFRQFTPFVRRLAPDKPVMLAPNCFQLRGAEATYRELLPNLDILCPFGFHRMPAGDMTGEEAARWLQSACAAAGCHLWMDLESFVFRNGTALHPRPIDGLVGDFRRFPNFEKTLHYQFPGMMISPEASRKPGGPPAVKLYLDYKRYLDGLKSKEAALRPVPNH